LESTNDTSTSGPRNDTTALGPRNDTSALGPASHIGPYVIKPYEVAVSPCYKDCLVMFAAPPGTHSKPNFT